MDANDDTLAVNVLAGATGGIAAVLLGQPLDTVKVKMQLFPELNLFEYLKNTVRKKGLRGLYAGTLPAMISNCLDNSFMFGAYGLCQKTVASLTYGEQDDTTRLSYLQNAAAGSLASIFTSTVTCPLELVKIRMQVSKDFKAFHATPKPSRPSARPVMQKIYERDGLRGFYRGMVATVAREAVAGAVFFGAYEWTRERLRPANGRKEDCDVLATVTAGAAAGGCSWLVIYPLDVIKSRVQISSMRPTAVPGLFSSLYSGLWPTMIKVVPVAGVLLYAVEFSKPHIRRALADLRVRWPGPD